VATRSTVISGALYDYIVESTVREPEVLRDLRDETAGLPQADCQISAEQGQFMALVAQMIGTKKALEVGTFTGYSSTVVALALPDDAQLICCDMSEEWTAIARRYWQRAGVAHKIDLRLGPAGSSLEKLIAQGEGGTFDFAFIDADKTGYKGYYEQTLRLLRPGGVMMFDNMLWEGRVAEPSRDGADTEAIRQLNEFAGRDDRVMPSLLSIGDGVLMVMKR
jgi:caffeoyl-CoA O-methyltransferase